MGGRCRTKYEENPGTYCGDFLRSNELNSYSILDTASARKYFYNDKKIRNEILESQKSRPKPQKEAVQNEVEECKDEALRVGLECLHLMNSEQSISSELEEKQRDIESKKSIKMKNLQLFRQAKEKKELSFKRQSEKMKNAVRIMNSDHVSLGSLNSKQMVEQFGVERTRKVKMMEK